MVIAILPLRYVAIHLRISGRRVDEESCWMSRVWSTVSKALVMSSATRTERFGGFFLVETGCDGVRDVCKCRDCGMIFHIAMLMVSEGKGFGEVREDQAFCYFG